MKAFLLTIVALLAAQWVIHRPIRFGYMGKDRLTGWGINLLDGVEGRDWVTLCRNGGGA
jgi:hypothetical protein